MTQQQPTRSRIPPTRRGHDFAEVASALQKSIRRGQEDDALHWAVELAESGFEQFVWRRLLVMTSEDVGLAEPGVAADVRALFDNWRTLHEKRDDRQRAWRLPLVHAVLLLARARKSRIVDSALIAFYQGDEERREVPDVALDKHTAAGRRKGRGWSHFFAEGAKLENEVELPDPYVERAQVAVMGSAVAAQAERRPPFLDSEGER